MQSQIQQLAKTLDAIADCFEGQPAAGMESGLEARFKHLEQTVETFGSRDLQRALPEQLQTFLALSRRSEELVSSLDREIRKRP
jgi:hypothetical protein